MGKNLIVNGADFSANGFSYTITTQTNNDLYKQKGTQISSADWPLVKADTKYYYASKNDDTLKSGGQFSISAAVSTTLSIPAGCYKVGIKTIMMGGYASDTVAAPVLLGFLGSNGKIIGGYTSAANTTQIGTCPLTPVGTGVKDLEMNVPSGAVSVVATYEHNTYNPFDGYYLITFHIIS